LCSVLS